MASKQSTMTKAMAVVMMAASVNPDTLTQSSASASNIGPVYPKDTNQTSKGKRSRRRRSAKMRAKNCKHIDGFGWLTPEEYMPLCSSECI